MEGEARKGRSKSRDCPRSPGVPDRPGREGGCDPVRASCLPQRTELEALGDLLRQCAAPLRHHTDQGRRRTGREGNSQHL